MPGEERYATYDEFAWCYSRGWGAEFHAQARAVFDNHVFPRLTPGARVLDLCCGSGDLSAYLVERGFRVRGLDGSERMLEYARQKAPGAEFLLADARNFHADSTFSAVASTFDSLNHILTAEQLQCAFRNVRAALEDGGLFVFDLNMSESFETLWRAAFSSVEDDCVSVTRGSYDRESGIGCAAITVFRLDGEWRRSDVNVFEKCYSEDEVRSLLERAGFREIVAADAYELGMRGDVALGRTFFFAVK